MEELDYATYQPYMWPAIEYESTPYERHPTVSPPTLAYGGRGRDRGGGRRSRLSSSSSPWYQNRQLKRRTRLTKYRLYAFEGKVKTSLKKGFRWIKRACKKIVHGF